jgi:hypothetical protein
VAGVNRAGIAHPQRPRATNAEVDAVECHPLARSQGETPVRCALRPNVDGPVDAGRVAPDSEHHLP